MYRPNGAKHRSSSANMASTSSSSLPLLSDGKSASEKVQNFFKKSKIFGVFSALSKVLPSVPLSTTTFTDPLGSSVWKYV